MQELFQYLSDSIVEAVYPYHCICGKWGTILCPTCSQNVEIINTEVCPICKKLSPHGQTCPGCRQHSNLTGVMVLGSHDGVLKTLIWKYKYGPIKAITPVFGDMLYKQYGEFLKKKRPLITSVPTSPVRLSQRGYNQAAELGDYLAQKAGLIYLEALARPKDTLHQVGLTRKERLANAPGSILDAGHAAGMNKRILVVDDVYTTGATLEECAKILRQQGYREVWGMVLSRD